MLCITLFITKIKGLRILPINVTEGLLDALRRHLYDVEYNPFYVPRGSVRVISGEEEGVFAWVAANYLKGFFWSDRYDRELYIECILFF